MQEMQNEQQETLQSGEVGFKQAPDAAEQNKASGNGKRSFAGRPQTPARAKGGAGAGNEYASARGNSRNDESGEANGFTLPDHVSESSLPGRQSGDPALKRAKSGAGDGGSGHGNDYENGDGSGFDHIGAVSRETLSELLSGDPALKREYDEAVRKIINRRFKTNRENEEKLRRLNGILPTISRRFGTPDGDLEALAAAIERSEAKSRAAAEREKRGRAALYDKWDRDIPRAAEKYPGFDMRREMRDPRFARLAVTVGVVEAYETVHRKELDAALVARARADAAAEVAGSVASNFTRPVEGGLSNTSAPLVKVDPRSLTREERLEVRRRLKRGEKVRF